jgi:hypothetical protein
VVHGADPLAERAMEASSVTSTVSVVMPGSSA